jgi:hypothetical protein
VGNPMETCSAATRSCRLGSADRGRLPTRRPLQSFHQGGLGLPALCPLSMGKAPEEAEEVKAHNPNFSKKVMRSPGDGLHEFVLLGQTSHFLAPENVTPQSGRIDISVKMLSASGVV